MLGKEGSANDITVGQNVHFYSLSCPNAYGDISKGLGLIKIKIKGDKSNWKKIAENMGPMELPYVLELYVHVKEII